MKNFLSSIFCFLKSYFLQALLSIVAIVSFDNAYSLGKRTFSKTGTFKPYNRSVEWIGTDVEVSTGFAGGALAMGLVCCVCIIMIVWIEINKKPKA